MLRKRAFQDLTIPAIRLAAETLGATLFELDDREHMLMVRGLEGFLVYIDPYTRSLTTYCCIIGTGELTPARSGELQYHQRGEPLARDTWVALSSITGDAPASYYIKKENADGSFDWVARKAPQFQDILFTAADSSGLTANLGARMGDDFGEQIVRLSSSLLAP